MKVLDSSGDQGRLVPSSPGRIAEGTDAQG